MTKNAMSWWANRKSRMGLRKIVALPPPHLPDGREWWCAPPVSLPEPTHIDYVVEFQRALISHPPSRNKNAMQQAVAAWLKAARRLCHERMAADRGGLLATDDLIVAASGTLQEMISIVVNTCGPEKINDRTREVRDALRGRANEILRRKAMEP